MKRNLWAIAGLSIMLWVVPGAVLSITTDQFLAMCGSGEVECHHNPFAQAYVGGALDLIATLDENTSYLGELYCKKPEELFDVPSIIQFMVEHQKDYGSRNAMLLVVRYLEENGGCER